MSCGPGSSPRSRRCRTSWRTCCVSINRTRRATAAATVAARQAAASRRGGGRARYTRSPRRRTRHSGPDRRRHDRDSPRADGAPGRRLSATSPHPAPTATSAECSRNVARRRGQGAESRPWRDVETVPASAPTSRHIADSAPQARTQRRPQQARSARGWRDVADMARSRDHGAVRKVAPGRERSAQSDHGAQSGTWRYSGRSANERSRARTLSTSHRAWPPAETSSGSSNPLCR